MYMLRKKARKFENIIFLDFIAIFHNVAFKIETSWIERVVQPILETRNVNDVWIYVCFTLSDIKYLFGASEITDV